MYCSPPTSVPSGLLQCNGGILSFCFGRLRPYLTLLMFAGDMTAKKWNRLLVASLMASIVLGVNTAVFVLVFLVPKVAAISSDLNAEIPQFFQAAITIGGILFRYWFVWLALAGGAFWLFEKRCVSEHKPVYRNLGLSGLALVSVGFSFWISLSTLVWLFMVFPAITRGN